MSPGSARPASLARTREHVRLPARPLADPEADASIQVAPGALATRVARPVRRLGGGAPPDGRQVLLHRVAAPGEADARLVEGRRPEAGVREDGALQAPREGRRREVGPGELDAR